MAPEILPGGYVDFNMYINVTLKDTFQIVQLASEVGKYVLH